jgi:hypothetical protein
MSKYLLNFQIVRSNLKVFEKYISNFLSYLFFGIILIYSLYGCVVYTTSRIEEPIAFKLNSDLVILTPDQKLLCVHQNEFNQKVIGWKLFKFERKIPIHYFGALYNIDSNNLPFGIRYYPNSKEIWLVNLEFLDKNNFESKSALLNTLSSNYSEVFKLDENGDLWIDSKKFGQIDFGQNEKKLVNQYIN